jgi:hypothetical protein
MLAKCANPACSAKFLCLHEGTLFAIQSPKRKESTRGLLWEVDMATTKDRLGFEKRIAVLRQRRLPLSDSMEVSSNL